MKRVLLRNEARFGEKKDTEDKPVSQIGTVAYVRVEGALTRRVNVLRRTILLDFTNQRDISLVLFRSRNLIPVTRVRTYAIFCEERGVNVGEVA